MAQLLNRAVAEGSYDGADINNFSELSVELSALEVKKTADRKIWVKDNLEYTIIVTNIDDRDPDDDVNPGLDVIGVDVMDTIDPTIATLVPDSVFIDGTQATSPGEYEFNPETGELIVHLGDIPAGESKTITFQVSLVQ